METCKQRNLEERGGKTTTHEEDVITLRTLKHVPYVKVCHAGIMRPINMNDVT